MYEAMSASRRLFLIAGADGIFTETHPEPDTALRDGPNTIPLAETPKVLANLVKVWNAVH